MKTSFSFSSLLLSLDVFDEFVKQIVNVGAGIV